MPKKLTINQIREEALHKYDLSLLSTEYINSMSKLSWLDNNTGIVFSREWHSIKSGHILPVNPNKKLTIDTIQELALKNYNITLVSEIYINNSTKMEWIDNDTGNRFYRSWNDIESGHLLPVNNNDYERDKHKIESYKGLGYKYNQTEEQYLASSNKAGRIFVIEHPSLSEPWITTMAKFIRGAEAHLSHLGMSYGENVIYSVLAYNHIKFETQYSVAINNKIHKFDFFIPSYNLFIEYDGEQHYHPIKHWGGKDAFIERIKRDTDKNEYSHSIGFNMLRIPYTDNTRTDIFKKMVEYIETLTLPNNNCLNNERVQEIATYYKCHTIKETMTKFSISKNTVSKYYKKTYGTSKQKRKAMT